MLYPLLPRVGTAPIRRALFVAEALWKVLVSPEGDPAWERRVAELRADLEVFVESETLDPKYLFLLYPASAGVWEIRSVRHAPSIRVLGMFADKDVFIATGYALREELGGWESREWKRAKRDAAARWHGLFHPYSSRKIDGAKDLQQLATGALDGKYFKS